MRNSKRGITVTSIVVYVILFFMFTTVTTIISSRFNENLFNDRGMAINVTAINKLEYNLLDSASKSKNAEIEVENETENYILKFSNSDVYEFDKNKQIIYKNGGKLVEHLKDYDIDILNYNSIKVNVTLNKYMNVQEKNIIINIETFEDGLIAYYDGINNVGKGEQDNTSTIWKDISSSNSHARLSSSFTLDGTNDGWVENGLLFPQASGATYNAIADYSGLYDKMTVEICLTTKAELTSNTSALAVITKSSTDEEAISDLSASQVDSMPMLHLRIRTNYLLMHGFGNVSQFKGSESNDDMLNNDNMLNKVHTFTYVQENFATRAVYIDGVLYGRITNLPLKYIEFKKLILAGNTHFTYIMHSVKIYDRVLTESEMLNNSNNNKIRFEG